MSRLFSANMMRLRQSWIFLLEEIFMVGYAIFVYANAGINVARGEVVQNWNIYFYNVLLVSGIAMALFVSVFLNAEYNDGTVRNKVMVGHRRRDIYLVNLITCLLAGLIMCLTYYVVGIIFGYLFVGREVMRIQDIGAGLIGSILIFLVYTAIFVLVEMLDKNKTRSIEINLIGAVLILAVGIICFGSLMGHPDTAGFMWHVIGVLFPSVLVMYIAGAESVSYFPIMIGLFIETACLIGIGLWRFGKKDIQ